MTSNKGNPKAGIGCLLTVIAVGFAIKLLIVLLTWTWPVWPWLALSSTGWYLAARGEGERRPRDRKEDRSGKEQAPRSGSKTSEPASEESQAGFLRDAAKSTLAYVTVGLMALTLALILINAFHDSVSPETVRGVETGLIHAKLVLKEKTESLPLFFALLVGALIVSHFAPRLKALAGLNWLRTAATAVYVALVAVTSFTLFAQAPLQDLFEDAAGRNREQIVNGVERYQALLRKERDAVGRYIAARAVSDKLRELDPQQRERLKDQLAALSSARQDLTLTLEEIFHCQSPGIPPNTRFYDVFQKLQAQNDERCRLLSVARRGQDRVSAGEKIQSLAQERVVRRIARSTWRMEGSEALRARSTFIRSIPTVPVANAEIPSEEPPADLRDWEKRLQASDEQERRIDAERVTAEKAEKAASDQILAAKMTLSQLLGSIGPGLEGLIGAYVDEAVDNLVDVVFERVVEPFYEKNRPSDDLSRLAKRIDLSLIKVQQRDLKSDDSEANDEATQLRSMVAEEIRNELENQTQKDPPRFLLTKEEILEREFPSIGVVDPLDPHPWKSRTLPETEIKVDPVHPVEPVHPMVAP